MLTRTGRKLHQPKVGDCVAVFISEFDRGRADPANVIGVILEERNGMFEIGTKGGIVDNWLPRDAFECVKYTGLTKDKIPSIRLSLREIVRELSVGNGQGIVRCKCRGKCKDRRCKCFRANVECNSAFHNQRTCDNPSGLDLIM